MWLPAQLADSLTLSQIVTQEKLGFRTLTIFTKNGKRQGQLPVTELINIMLICYEGIAK